VLHLVDICNTHLQHKVEEPDAAHCSSPGPVQVQEVKSFRGSQVRRMASFVQRRLSSNPSPIYGDGFREAEGVLADLQKHGASTRTVLSEMLAHISKHRALPAVREAVVPPRQRSSWWRLFDAKLAHMYQN
jgi:hypothetical protein